MSSDEFGENAERLPSTVGSGWLQVSVDDRVRDRRVILNNLMRELCMADQQARQNGRTAELTIEDVWSLRAFNPDYVRTFIRDYENERHYIQMNSEGRISLTETGRQICTRFT
jgi:hypothetical protein